MERKENLILTAKELFKDGTITSTKDIGLHFTIEEIAIMADFLLSECSKWR